MAANGAVCVNTLKRDWKPDHGIKHILLVSPLPNAVHTCHVGFRTQGRFGYGLTGFSLCGCLERNSFWCGQGNAMKPDKARSAAPTLPAVWIPPCMYRHVHYYYSGWPITCHEIGKHMFKLANQIAWWHNIYDVFSIWLASLNTISWQSDFQSKVADCSLDVNLHNYMLFHRWRFLYFLLHTCRPLSVYWSIPTLSQHSTKKPANFSWNTIVTTQVGRAWWPRSTPNPPALRGILWVRAQAELGRRDPSERAQLNLLLVKRKTRKRLWRDCRLSVFVLCLLLFVCCGNCTYVTRLYDTFISDGIPSLCCRRLSPSEMFSVCCTTFCFPLLA